MEKKSRGRSDAQKAKEVTSNAGFDYPLLLANSKQDADDYARDLQRILHEDNAKVDAFRMGWLQSSHGGKFIPEVASQKNGPIGPWYVEPPGSPNSCCQLSSACTEFSSQGLELSLALFNWGQDLQYREGSLATSETPAYRRQQDHYTFGSYRVLLSRGRNGLIVKCDDQQTLDFLVRCGMKECRGANAVTA
ncbi:DNA/RNA helicase domain-containing protein [Paracoccus marcusii]|uniref:DNA/RNA helicase domain-containing protein n=1 Tax=Paracoccus marcusii TaxID=59779 RepID=UPI003262FD19